jgi:hypothetical protein
MDRQAQFVSLREEEMATIYDKPVHQLMKNEMVATLHLKTGDVFTKEQVKAWFSANYPKIKDATISAHLLRLSVNAKSRVHYSAKPGEDNVFYQIDSSHFRLYNPANDPTPISETSVPLVDEDPSKELSEDIPGSAQFAYEKDLQSFLAKNLNVIGPGLRLYDEEGVTGIEFPVGGRFIDLLAIDPSGNYVVIELKVSRGYDRVVGQLLRYMAWIKKNQAEGQQSVRGIIVAREITDDLLLACSGIPNVQLFEYQMSVALRKVA